MKLRNRNPISNTCDTKISEGIVKTPDLTCDSMTRVHLLLPDEMLEVLPGRFGSAMFRLVRRLIHRRLPRKKGEFIANAQSLREN